MSALPAPRTPGREFLAGCRDEAPILLGVAPFGMIYGLLALKAGLPIATAQAMSSIVFAGSAQFIAAQLVKDQAPALVVIATVLVVNLRHSLYSASVAPRLRHLGLRWRCLLAYLLTDEAYAVAATRYLADDTRPEVPPSPHRHWYFLGAGLTLWVAWQLSTAAGLVLGAEVPSRWSLDFTLALTFIALVFPSLRDRASVVAALAAGAVAVLAAGLPYKLGLMLAAVVGIGAGVLLDRRRA